MGKGFLPTIGVGMIVLVVAANACAPQRAVTPDISPPPEQMAPLRIGASLALTGRYDRTGKEVMNGYQLWAEQLNAAGGLLGRKVEFLVYDDTSEPEMARNLYEKLITEDKVDVILGPYSSPVTIPASTVTEKYGYPMIVSGASATDIWTRGYKYVFGVYTMAPFYLDGALDIGAKNGHKTVAFMNENSAFAKDTMAGAERKAKELGLQIVFQEEYGRDVRDLTPVLSKIRALNPDLLLAGSYGEDATLIVRQLKDLNWMPKILALTVGPALPDFGQNLGPDAEYIFGATQWEASIRGPGVGEFVSSYKAKYGYEPGYHAAGGFGAAQLLQQAIQKVGAVDNQRIRDALATMETTTVYGGYKVDETGSQTAKPSFLIQIRNGERKIVWPDSAAETRYTVPIPEWGRR